MLHQDVAQGLVLSLRSYDDHVLVVLGSGADERDAAYVDFLDDVGLGCSAGYGCLKRIEVYDDEVYFGDFIFFDLLSVLLHVAAAQDASEYFRMEGLHAAAQDGRIGGELFHRTAGIAQSFDELAGAACREEFHSFFMQFADDFVQTVFMVNGYQCCFDSLCFRHGYMVFMRICIITPQSYKFCWFTHLFLGKKFTIIKRMRSLRLSPPPTASVGKALLSSSENDAFALGKHCFPP